MKPRSVYLLAMIVAMTSTGCTLADILQWDNPEKPKDWRDDLWKGGYGYNNPNPARDEAGLPPLNFNGSEGE